MTTISIVTGGSRGLGRNTAISIAKHGGDVILTYRNGAEEAKAVVAEIEALGRKAVALQLDVGTISAFPAFADAVRSVLTVTWSRINFDHLINNAGHGEMASFAETTEAQFDNLFNVHVKGGTDSLITSTTANIAGGAISLTVGGLDDSTSAK